MVYDCFQFFNELDILKLRMSILNEVVDYFVIAESTVTFSGEKKPLYFSENINMFKKFKNKVIHIVIDDTPDTEAFGRDVFQKNAVKRGLLNCKDEDIIIFSDVDEIPNPLVISKILKKFNNQIIYHMAQEMYYCYLNYKEISGELLSYTGEFENVKERKWLGSKICSYEMIKNIEIGDLRHPSTKEKGIRISDGGWHWGYLGGRKDNKLADRVIYKTKSAAHQEFNEDEMLKKVEQRIKRGMDIFGRNAEFTRVNIDNSYPSYLLENIQDYANWIMPKLNFVEKIILFMSRVNRKIKKYIRKINTMIKLSIKKLLKMNT